MCTGTRIYIYNRIESSETKPYIYAQLIFNKDAQNYLY